MSDTTKPEDRLQFYSGFYDRLFDCGMMQSLKGNGNAFTHYLCKRFEFKTVVDVGAGNGGDSSLFIQYGKKVTAVEVSQSALKNLARRGVPHVKASGTDLPFKDGSVDMVAAFDFMEHLRECDVPLALNEFYRVTRRYVALQIGLANAKPVKIPPEYEYDDIHLTLWERDQWIAHFDRVGFQIINITSKHPPGQTSRTQLLYVILEKPNVKTEDGSDAK